MSGCGAAGAWSTLVFPLVMFDAASCDVVFLPLDGHQFHVVVSLEGLGLVFLFFFCAFLPLTLQPAFVLVSVPATSGRWCIWTYLRVKARP